MLIFDCSAFAIHTANEFNNANTNELIRRGRGTFVVFPTLSQSNVCYDHDQEKQVFRRPKWAWQIRCLTPKVVVLMNRFSWPVSIMKRFVLPV